MNAAPPNAPLASEVLRQARTENFPVASFLFPPEVRPHLVAVYGFARLADDIGDEAEGDRLALLDWLSGELDAVFDEREPSHAVMIRLARTVRSRALPREPFDRLVEANRRDQAVSRYETFDAVREYCALSADPVGELVLRTCGAWSPRRAALSDDVCTGLQLVEFWQDLGEDAAKGRLYVPLEDMHRYGLAPEEVVAGPRDGRSAQRFEALMRFEAERTRVLLSRGRDLSRSIGGRVGVAIRLFAAGGLAALQDLRQRRFDTFRQNARASRRRRALWALRELATP
jgi:squalene synthase HpnC